MVKILWFALVIVVATVAGIVVHTANVEWVLPWIAHQMNGQPLISSWQVRDLAIITAVEYGVATLVIYLLAREQLQRFSKLTTTVIFAALLLMLHGNLLRQPIMDFAIGNLLSVVLLQNGIKWLMWLLVSAVIVYGSEWVISHSSKR